MCVQDDLIELRAGELPENLPAFAEFLQLMLVQKYGLPSLSESHMYGIVESTQVRRVVVVGLAFEYLARRTRVSCPVKVPLSPFSICPRNVFCVPRKWRSIRLVCACLGLWSV